MEKEVIEFFQNRMERTVMDIKEVATKKIKLEQEVTQLEQQKRVLEDQLTKIKTALQYMGLKI